VNGEKTENGEVQKVLDGGAPTATDRELKPNEVLPTDNNILTIKQTASDDLKDHNGQANTDHVNMYTTTAEQQPKEKDIVLNNFHNGELVGKPKHINGAMMYNGKRIITIADYESLEPIDLLKFDKRTSFEFLKDLLVLDHALLTFLFKRSFKDPFFLRLIKLTFSLSLQFGINAMLFTDQYIESRAEAASVSYIS
jgi:hypothetical protein